MNGLKKIAGLIWMLAAPVLVYVLVSTAISEINRNPVIDTKIQWGVFVVVFIPIAIGFFVFGWLAFKGEYSQLPEKSEDIR
ncbi:DUF6814 family protein [Pollutibacter soli]|uniref:DUF6814 family protein n=1 Tax=Pollutibacter soli TaxID=3034157 RepID=UPI0030137AF2